MHQVRSFFAPDRYSAKKMAKPINFVCVAPDAKQVHLAGDFNDWDPAATPLCRMPDGRWMASPELPHGYHQYLFLVDGRPALDPKARGIACNNRNGRVSIVAVS